MKYPAIMGDAKYKDKTQKASNPGPSQTLLCATHKRRIETRRQKRRTVSLPLNLGSIKRRCPMEKRTKLRSVVVVVLSLVRHLRPILSDWNLDALPGEAF